MMVGRAISQTYPKVDCTPGETVLEVTDLCVILPSFTHISFRLRKGEILGFYGLVGAGRTELMRALSGVSHPSSGEIRLNGRTMRFHLARRRHPRGHRLRAGRAAETGSDHRPAYRPEHQFTAAQQAQS